MESCVESRGICPPAPKKKLKYHGLNTKEILIKPTTFTHYIRGDQPEAQEGGYALRHRGPVHRRQEEA